MPSDRQGQTALLSGRCYCGQTSFTADGPPLTVAYCHCSDCRRWTGAPLPAFAAVQQHTIRFSRTADWRSHIKGVERVNCPDCGSPMAARFDYLPDHIYLPIGILDQASLYPPQMHCHTDARLPWLHVADDLPTSAASGRARLLSSRPVSGT